MTEKNTTENIDEIIWITLPEAVEITKVSRSTADRFVRKYKDSDEYTIKTGSGRRVNKKKFIEENPIPQAKNEEKSQSNGKDHKISEEIPEPHEETKQALAVVAKQANDISKFFIEEKPIYKKSVFWVTFAFIVLIIILAGAGWLYRTELLNVHREKIDLIAQSHNKELSSKDVLIKNKDEMIKNKIAELKKSENQILKQDQQFEEIKKAHKDLSDYQKKQLQKNEKALEQYEQQIKELQVEIKILKPEEQSSSDITTTE